MPVLRAQNILTRATGLPADATVNVWHFLVTGAISDAIVTEVNTALTAFYGALLGLYPNTIFLSPRTVKYYDLSHPEPRAPVSTRGQAWAPTGSIALPEECSVCLSFSADVASGQNRARQRGRVYLGPLSSNCAAVVSSRVVVASSVQTQIASAAQTLLNSSLAATTWKWAIYSPTSAAAGGSEESWVVPVAHGWVDDAFDTQRRRGTAPRSRVTFT